MENFKIIVSRIAVKVITNCIPLFKLFQKKNRVSYYPAFKNIEDLSSHYHRALWYLPDKAGCKVAMVVSAALDVDKDYLNGNVPRGMQKPLATGKNIFLYRGFNLDWFSYFFRSKAILVWDTSKLSLFLKVVFLIMGKVLILVDTKDARCSEYISYAFALSRMQAFSITRRRRLVYRERLLEVIKNFNGEKAYVFGTGPSLEQAYRHDFSDGLRIICNSIVKNKKLLDHIEPHFITAGDSVSHYGVSEYAAAFRRDLVKAARSTGAYFIFPEFFEPLVRSHLPELLERSIAVPYRSMKGLNFSLKERFYVNGMVDSILNQLMLPLAATVSKDIFLLGCDGKITGGDNEDFWSHDLSSQYRDMVETGHICHPTFNTNREERLTLDKYYLDVEKIISVGEALGISFKTLAPSFIPALKSREAGRENADKNRD